MQRRVLFIGAGAIIVLAGLLGLRAVTRHQAGQVVDQGIDQFLARLPPGYAVRHGMVDYNPLTSTATVHSVVVTHDGVTLETADSVTVSGGNAQALQDVFDPAAYPGGKPAWTDRRLLIADASARNVHIVQGAQAPGTQGSAIVIGRATLHRLSGRPFMLPPSPENRARPDVLADAALALAADTVQLNDITLATPAAGSFSSGAAMTVGSVALSDYDGGKLGSVAGKSLALDGNGKLDADGKLGNPPFHMTVEAFDLKSANLRGVLEAIRQTGRPERGLLGRVTYGSAGLSGMALDVAAGPHVAMQNMHVTQILGGAGPSTGTAAIHGLTIATGQTTVSPAAAALLAAFGMNAVTMDLDATSTMPAKVARPGAPPNAPSVVHEDVVLRGLGTLHLQGSFSGDDAALASAEKPLAAFMETTLDGASIVYEDHSLTNRLFAVAAVQMHSTPDLVRGQLAMPVLTLGMMLPGQPDAADQLTNFLNHPGTLTITMTPPQKTTLAQIAQAPVPARAQMLGVHITSK